MKEGPTLTWRDGAESEQEERGRQTKSGGGKGRKKEKVHGHRWQGGTEKRGTLPKTGHLEGLHESPRKCRDSKGSRRPAGG